MHDGHVVSGLGWAWLAVLGGLAVAGVTATAGAHGRPAPHSVELELSRAFGMQGAAGPRPVRVGDWAGTLTPTRVVVRDRGWSARGSVEGGGSFAFSGVGGVVTGGIWTDAGAVGVSPRLVDGRVVSLAERVRPGEGVRCASGCSAHPAGGPGVGRAGSDERGGLPIGFDDPSFVDVLFVYTPAARDAAGGLAALESRLQNTIDTTNLVFENSGIDDLEMVLAGVEEVAYDEASPAWLDHLVRVTEPGDGFMDGVHALRDAYNADCVMLIVDDARFTGGAAWWAIWDDGQAFSVLNWRSAGGGDLTGPHEFGHTFGCAHDHDNDLSAPFSFSWGHYYTVGPDTFHTVMAYPGNVHVPYFSDPSRTGPGGQPLGVPVGEPRAAYNALVIEHTRWTIAGYRPSGRVLDCNNNGVADDVDLSNGTSIDANADGRPDECESRFYVDQDAVPQGDGRSWAGAHADLGETLALAGLLRSDITEVWAADGVHRPDSGTGDRWRGFDLSPGLTLAGGFQGLSGPGGGESSLGERTPGAFATVLSGDIGVPGDDADNSYSVVRAEFFEVPARLDGLTIRDGRSFADASGLHVYAAGVDAADVAFIDNAAAGSGAGCGVFAASSVALRECRFESNSAGWVGGAIAAYDGSLVSVVDCTFTGNEAVYAGAIGVANGVWISVSGSTLSSNTASEAVGAIDVDLSSTLDLRGCLLEGNRAVTGWSGAVRIGGGSTLDAAGCDFRDNHAGWIGGAISSADSVVRVHASSFEANSAADYGGAVDLWNTEAEFASVAWAGNTSGIGGGGVAVAGGSDVTIAGSTLAANHAGDLGGGLVSSDSDLDVSSSILWGNTSDLGEGQDDQVFVYSGAVVISWSDVQGWSGTIPGLANIDADPLFVSPTDLRLSSGSPCVDAGSNADLPADSLDLDGDGDPAEPIALDAGGEARLTDVPSAADTGVGPAPIVDLGAFERAVPPCPADLAHPLGVLDLADVLAFIGAFTAQQPPADLAPPLGVFDLGDVLAFVSAFTGGCP